MSDSRLIPRSSPRKSATNSSTGHAQVLGVHLGEDPADLEDGDAVRQLDGLVDVVGDQHDRLLHPLLQLEQLVLERARTMGSTAE